MRRRTICFLLALVSLSPCVAEVTKLPEEQRKVLEDSSRFREVHATTNLPPAIVALCAGSDGRLAEPGQKWEPTDFIRDRSLPRKRLIWAATTGDYYVVHYERAGYAHSFHILVASVVKGEEKPKVVWRGVGERLKDYSAFLSAMRSGKLDDKLDYAN